ncbi:hypothetical protein D1AOALGA4SA_205 [Olavius algarvensis Delta 1 endosymbiont]|nr:hypothetical protein D1AOALGA4SA_205 [Olavius algarvensis Delta 1 endosymbiont]
MGISAQAMVGQASEAMPFWIQAAGALMVLLLSVKPLYRLAASLKARISRGASATGEKPPCTNPESEDLLSSTGRGST